MNQFGQQYGYNFNNYPNNQYSYLQPYQSYQQPIQQSYQNSQQNPINQQQEFSNTIPCAYVDSIKVVEATNSDMSGKPLLFMKSDGTEIYRKQLNPNTGASDLFTYEIKKNIEPQTVQPSDKYDFTEINSKLDSFKEDIYGSISSFRQEVSELKDLMLESITAPQQSSSKSQAKAGDRR